MCNVNHWDTGCHFTFHYWLPPCDIEAGCQSEMRRGVWMSRVNITNVQSNLSSKYVRRPVQSLSEDTADRRIAKPFAGPHMNEYEYRLCTPSLFSAPLSSRASLTRGNFSYSVCQCPQRLRVWFIRYYLLGKPTSFQWKYSLKYFCS